MTTEEQFLKHFGRRIADIRNKRGVSQEKLAEAVGIHRTYVGFVEQGKRNPSIGNIRKISKALGVSLNELFRPFK